MPERSHVCVFDVEGAICDYSGSIEVKLWSGSCASNPDEYDMQSFCSCNTSGKPRQVRMLKCFTQSFAEFLMEHRGFSHSIQRGRANVGKLDFISLVVMLLVKLEGCWLPIQSRLGVFLQWRI